MKRINRILVIILIVIMLIPNTVFASIINPELKKLNITADIVSQYIGIDSKGNGIYNKQQAIEDGLDKETLKILDDVYQLFVSYENYEKGITTYNGMPIYGNWCGPGHGGGSAVDMLDLSCFYHDTCYGNSGYHKCSCDQDLKDNIARFLSSMGTAEKAMAHVIYAWAHVKVSNPGSEGGNLSCKI